ncbi:hypothetical protein [Agrobacterium leguminum]
MAALIEKARTATTDQLLEMAMLLNDASDKIGAASRMAVMVVLEERIGAYAFATFCDGLEA